MAAGNALEDDAAASLREALAEDLQGFLDPGEIVVGGDGDVLRRQRLGRDHEQRLDRPDEVVDRVGPDQAERTFHELSPSSAITGVPAWETNRSQTEVWHRSSDELE